MASFFVMQHKERRETNEMAIHIGLLTVFDVQRPTQSFPCLWFPLLAITVAACLPVRQGQPKAPPPAARKTFRATHARDNPHSMLCGAHSVRVLRRP
jgi:hypothetical protein